VVVRDGLADAPPAPSLPIRGRLPRIRIVADNSLLMFCLRIATVLGMVSVRAQFAENLQTARKRAGLSQERLAELSDLHRTEISLLERASRSPRLETIVALSRALPVDGPRELLEGIR
jgi:DNA-binding XRE family transcriptional regulator